MGNKLGGSYKAITDQEEFARVLLHAFRDFRHGSKGFTSPLEINAQQFDRYLNFTTTFDPFEPRDWEALIEELRKYCSVEYTGDLSYNNPLWVLIVSDLDKNWNKFEKLANYTILQARGELWIGLSTIHSGWFNMNDKKHVKSLFLAVQKVEEWRSVPLSKRLSVEKE